MRNSSDEVNDRNTPLKRIAEIAGNSYYAETSQETAMWRIVKEFKSSFERDKALATIINVSGLKRSNIREAAATALLESPTATNDELIRIVLHADARLKKEAAERMIKNGELTEFQINELQKWVPSLMEKEDSERNQFDRENFIALTSSSSQRK